MFSNVDFLKRKRDPYIVALIMHELAFWSLLPVERYFAGASVQGGGAWSSLNFLCQTLWTPHGQAASPFLRSG